MKYQLLLLLFSSLLFINCISDSDSQSETTSELSVENTYQLCTDSLDNNQNGFIDCEDQSCFTFAICQQEPLDPINNDDTIPPIVSDNLSSSSHNTPSSLVQTQSSSSIALPTTSSSSQIVGSSSHITLSSSGQALSSSSSSSALSPISSSSTTTVPISSDITLGTSLVELDCYEYITCHTNINTDQTFDSIVVGYQYMIDFKMYNESFKLEDLETGQWTGAHLYKGKGTFTITISCYNDGSVSKELSEEIELQEILPSINGDVFESYGEEPYYLQLNNPANVTTPVPIDSVMLVVNDSYDTLRLTTQDGLHWNGNVLLTNDYWQKIEMYGYDNDIEVFKVLNGMASPKDIHITPTEVPELQNIEYALTYSFTTSAPIDSAVLVYKSCPELSENCDNRMSLYNTNGTWGTDVTFDVVGEYSMLVLLYGKNTLLSYAVLGDHDEPYIEFDADYLEFCDHECYHLNLTVHE
ncbi:MAG: hypothetical protein OCD01_14700 [Fibrobacterales bacterium]